MLYTETRLSVSCCFYCSSTDQNLTTSSRTVHGDLGFSLSFKILAFTFFLPRQKTMTNLSIRGAQQLSNMSLQYLSNTSWLLADQRFRLGVAVALPCVFLALAWRTIASKDTPQDTPQEPTPTEKSSTQAQKPQTKPNDITTKTATAAPATNTRVTMRAPHPITATANAPTQAPAVPPKAAAAVRAPRYRRTVPEKKSEVVVVQVEEDERPATPETPTSKPKRKSTTITAESIAPVLLAQEQQQEQYHHQHHEQHQQQQFRSPAPRQAHQEPDVLSISSNGSSTEQQPSSSASSNYKNRTVRMGKNLKRAWSKRPFAWNSPTAPPVQAGESILFPDSPTIPSVNLRR
jgi:hypothetical protein